LINIVNRDILINVLKNSWWVSLKKKNSNRGQGSSYIFRYLIWRWKSLKIKIKQPENTYGLQQYLINMKAWIKEHEELKKNWKKISSKTLWSNTFSLTTSHNYSEH